MREKPYLFSLNGGEVSPLAMGRVDLARMRLSGETCLNVIPRVIGPIQARPGTKYLGSTDGDGIARNIPFVFSATDTAKVELSDLKMRVWVSDTLISRASVSTVITNGDMESSTGWTLTETGTGFAEIDNASYPNTLALQTPGRGDTASASRSDSISGPDQNVEHAIEITVDRGPVRFRLGSTNGGQEYINEIDLETGFHSLAFTPTGGTIYVTVSAESETVRIVSDISIASSGTMEIVTPWDEDDLFELRYDQSGDTIFVVGSQGNYMPKKIVRFGTKSWSLVDYKFTDGPFRGKTGNLTLSPSVTNGNGTLTASKAFFDAGHVGCVFRLTHTSTTVTAVLTGDDRYTDTIRVNGNTHYDVDSDGVNEDTTERDVRITISGIWIGRVSLQVSYDNAVTWTETDNWTNNLATETITPGYANSDCLVRIGFIGNNHGSGSATVSMIYDGGGGDGYVVITAVASSTSASYEVIKRLHKTGTTNEWAEGRFSTFRGWPSAVTFFEGRLWWGGGTKIIGSISDNFESFDEEEDTDAGPIIRSISTGGVSSIRWLLALSRLCIGTAGGEPVGRSSSFDEPVTPSNFSLKNVSTQGSADVQAVTIDKAGIFVQRSGKRAYLLDYSIDSQDYGPTEMTRFHPTILGAGVKVMAVQRQPDTRIWLVLSDGTAAVLLFEPQEDVLSWFRFETVGTIEDVMVLPNTEDDDVHLIVNRPINGMTVRYQERIAYDHEAQGGATNYMADGFVTATLSASDTFTGLGHLEGEDVVVWVDSAPIMDGDAPATFTVASGSITLDQAYTGLAIAGLAYTWQWQSAKLAYGVRDGNPISRRKKVSQVAPVLYKTHIRGIQYGYDFDNMTYLPLVSNVTGAVEDTSKLYDTYDPDHQALPGVWDTDARVCLQGQAPLPCTVLALSLIVDAN